MRRVLGVAALAGLLAMTACGDDGDDDAATPTTAVSTTTAGPTCSASGLSPTVSADSTVPAVVAKMRADIAKAAAACDYAALAELVDRNGRGVRFSFGDGTDAIAAWEAAEAGTDNPKPLRALRLLLGLKAGTQDLDRGEKQFAWPRAHVEDQPDDEMLQEVADTGLYDMATLRKMIAGGSGYLGYRILITDDGDWSAFVAGD